MRNTLLIKVLTIVMVLLYSVNLNAAEQIEEVVCTIKYEAVIKTPDGRIIIIKFKGENQ